MPRAFVPVTPNRHRIARSFDAWGTAALYVVVHVTRGVLLLAGGHLCNLLDRPGNLARPSAWRQR